MVTALFALAALGQPGIELTLTVDRASIKAGENLLFGVVAANRGKDPVLLLPSLDGSDIRKRGPGAVFQVRGPSGWSDLSYNVGRCGNTNPLSAQQFALVNPNDRFTLVKNSSWYPPSSTSVLGKPGTHHVRFLYDTTLPLSKWIGGPMSDEAHSQLVESIRPLYERVPKGQFVSNTLTITVR